MTLGETIFVARKKAKLTQTQLSKKIGVTQGALCKFEKNASMPKALTLLKLAHTLSIPTSKLFRLIKN